MNRRVKVVKLLSVLFLVMLLMAGCGGETPAEPTDPPPTPTEAPTNTPVPTDTPLPTDTPEPTATPTEIPTDTPVPTETPDLAATAAFESTQVAAAALAVVGEELAKYDISTDSGYLAWVNSEPFEIVTSMGAQTLYEPIDEGEVYSTYVLHADVKWDSETGLSGCGIMFHSEPNLEQGKQYQFITIRFSGLPLWAVELHQYGGFVSSATGGAKSNGAINQADGATNSYTLVVREGLMTVYANDTRLSNVIISTLNQGRIAFYTWQESGTTTCVFDNAWIFALEEE